MASLQVEVSRLNRLADDLVDIVHDAENLELKYQRLIAETALLRLFYSLEGAVMNMAFKLLTNSPYADGSHATLTVAPFRGMTAAEGAVLTAARSRGVRFLRWTQYHDLERNMAPFVAVTEHFIAQRLALDGTFEDMRKVRNHIAHSTRSTGVAFAGVVGRIYPTNPRGISPAKMLLSTRTAYIGAPGHGAPRIIEQYLRWAKVAIKVMAKA